MKVLGALALLASSVAVAAPVSFQLPAPNSQASPKSQAPASSLKSAIDDLGKFDDAARVQAAKTIRRAPAGPAVAALIEAATTHRDSYVRFRALVLLSGFNDPRARDIMSAALDDPNDRLRTVAYGYFEHNREHGMAPRLLKALNKEEGEFVRPALTRALAAYADDPAVPPVLSGLVMRGEDLFRSAVIEAIGDYHGAYALSQLTAVARQDGPLQEDAVLALGKIGDQHALGVLEELQKSAPRGRQPAVAAAICLLGVNCESHETFITDTARFAIQNSGYQELLRAAARSLGTLAEAGHAEAAVTLLDLGIPARDPARSPVALALGAVALRNTPLIVKVLGSRGDLRDCALLLRDAFDMLEEDYAQERFFATVRRSYWQAAAGTSDKKVADTLIQVLEF